MKISIVVLTVFALIASAYVTGCKTPAEKVGSAQTNVIEANKDLDVANKEYLADIEKYRKETADKIAANDKSITEFKARIDREKKTAKDEYSKKIMVLEQKNTDLKKKMDEYKSDGKEQWEAFKAEFSHDMDELGQAFKDLMVNNVK